MSSPVAGTSREPLQDMQNTMFAAEEAGGGAKARFNKLVVKAKQLARDGYVSKALEHNKKALLLFKNEKLVRRIKKMEAFLRDYDEESDGISEEEGENHSMVDVGNGFFLYKDLHDKLYDYQREGVLWMWGLYKKHKGGILGDDMGLGKTIQVIAFLSGMFDAEKIKSVMIVLPVAVMINWEREFNKWAPGIHIAQYHAGSKTDRASALRKVQHRGGVLLTSYGMLVNHAKELAEKDSRNFVWDYVILDEGHKIKNPSNKCSKGVQAVSAKQRLLLSGTPIMNNLKEMWALYDWAHQGTLLGRAKTFSMEYETPITKARQKDATAGEMRLGQEMAECLQKLISPYFLRRTKADMGDGPEVPTFTRKNDLVCWVFLSDIQQNIYEGFVNTPAVKELLNSTKSPLVALTVLKKICDHPRLLNNGQCVQLGIPVDRELMKGGRLSPELASECAAIRIDHIKTQDLVKESGKLIFLIGLVDKLKTEGHRCLIFSQSCKVLDIITKVLGERGHGIIRLDGSIRHLPEREKIIEKFTNDTSINVFLLTTQVGGVGLTITAANRVIIYDPSWNPATDAQAVDRAFRIGQEKDVVVYRLITCGSVEEKIYRRQIFKNSITKQATGESKNPFRYFSNQELFELFVLDNPRMSVTQVQLQDLHGGQETTDTSLDQHIAFMHTLEMFGISHHDVMFTKDAVVPPADDNSAQGEQYISGRVAKAQQTLMSECRDNKELARQLGHYPGSEVASQADKGVQGRRTAASRLMPPGASGQPWKPEDITIVHPTHQDTDRHIPSRLPVTAHPTRAEGSGEAGGVDLTQMPSDNEDNLETTMSKLDISETSTGAAIDSEEVAPPVVFAADTPSPTHPDPTPADLSTPVLPSSGARRRQLSATNTPTSAPRRRGRKSVCYSQTPRRLSSSPAANIVITTEHLIFSPHHEQPVVVARCPSNLDDITASLDYNTFSQHLQPNLNSTEMPSHRDALADVVVDDSPDVTPHHMRLRDGSMECSVVADSEDEVTSGQCQKSVCDSPLTVTKPKVLRHHAVVESSSEEDEEMHQSNTPEASVAEGGDSRDGHLHTASKHSSDGDDKESLVDEAVEADDSQSDGTGDDEDPSVDETQDDDDDDRSYDEEENLLVDDAEDDDSQSDDNSDPESDDNADPENDNNVDPESDDSADPESDDNTDPESDEDGAEEQKVDPQMKEDLKEEEDKEEERDDAGLEDVDQEGVEDTSGYEKEGEEGHKEEGEEEEDEGSEQEEEELSVQERENYLRFMMKSKELRAGGDLRGALRYAIRGLQIYNGDEGAKKYAVKLMKKLDMQC